MKLMHQHWQNNGDLVLKRQMLLSNLQHNAEFDILLNLSPVVFGLLKLIYVTAYYAYQCTQTLSFQMLQVYVVIHARKFLLLIMVRHAWLYPMTSNLKPTISLICILLPLLGIPKAILTDYAGEGTGQEWERIQQ